MMMMMRFYFVLIIIIIFIGTHFPNKAKGKMSVSEQPISCGCVILMSFVGVT
jgi:uncharacterized membrane protein (DUF485 family)